MRYLILPLLLCVFQIAILARSTPHAELPAALSIEEQQALGIGLAVMRLHELGKAGAPMMSNAQLKEFEDTVQYLSEQPSSQRMAWAWLEFRLRADQHLSLSGNPSADAISQRLELYPKLIRKYFVLE